MGVCGEAAWLDGMESPKKPASGAASGAQGLRRLAHCRRGETGPESAGLRASTRVFWHGIDVEAAVTVALAGLVALGLVWVINRVWRP